MNLCKCECGNMAYLDVGQVWKCPCGRTWQLLLDGSSRKLKLDFLGLRPDKPKESACKN